MTPPLDRRYRAFLVALVLSNAVHVLAVLAMVGPLAPGVDVHATPLARATFVAEHATRWRIGWSAWQLTAASDLALSVTLALVLGATEERRGRTLAWLSVLATLAAMVPDQLGEALIVTRLVEESSRARATGDASGFAALEAHVLTLTGTWGESLYALMLALWTAAAARAAQNERLFALLGGTTTALFLGASVVNARAPGSPATVALNGAGFGLLGLTLVFMGVVVGRAVRGARAPRLIDEPGLWDQLRVLGAPSPTLPRSAGEGG